MGRVINLSPTAEMLAKRYRCKLTDWAKGPPPAPGVWNASLQRQGAWFRRWTGEYWTIARTSVDAAAQETTPAKWAPARIEWRGLTKEVKL